jgi:hypothetical protein
MKEIFAELLGISRKQIDRDRERHMIATTSFVNSHPSCVSKTRLVHACGVIA